MLSDRAEKTDQVVILPASIDDPNTPPPGMYRIGFLATCVSIGAFFVALVIAYIWRAQASQNWEPLQLPGILRVSTFVIFLSSISIEAARRVFRRGERPTYHKLMYITAALTLMFLALQTTAWRDLVDRGVYLRHDPHSSFFYIFTGLHAAHVVGGIVALCVLLGTKSPRREVVNMVAYYWHFLFVLWIGLYATLALVS
jgi:cytochrome c oxidase subunit III